MAESLGKCTNCGKDVIPPDWNCDTGEEHIVPTKKFYMDDAPTDPGARMPGTYQPIGQPLKDSQTMICNLIPEKRETRGHDIVYIPGRNVTFKRGLYETNNAQEIYFLNKKSGLCSESRWAEVYLSPQEKLNIDRLKLEADTKRLETERNELLAQVQKLKKGQSAELR